MAFMIIYSITQSAEEDGYLYALALKILTNHAKHGSYNIRKRRGE
jgi:hypothetical protein